MPYRHSKVSALFQLIILLTIPSLNYSQNGSEFMVDPDTTFNQSKPAVALDKNGNWHIIYTAIDTTGEYIKHTLLNQDGEFSKLPHIIINVNLIPVLTIMGLSIATSQDYAVVGMRALDPIGKNIFFQILNIAGDPLIPIRRFPNATEIVGNINVCFMNDSTFYACYDDRKYGYAHEVVCIQLGYTAGHLSNEYQVVNDDSISSFYECAFATIASNLNSNSTVVVWQDDNSGIFQIYCKIFSRDLTAISSRILINEGMQENDRAYPEVKMASDGSFAVMWISKVDNHYNVYCRKFTGI